MLRKLFGAMLIAFMLITNILVPAMGNELRQGNNQKQCIQKAVAYFHHLQNRDGGFPSSKGGKSNPVITSWVIMALVAAGEDVSAKEWSPGNSSPAQYLKSSKLSLDTLGDYDRILMALTAAGQGNCFQGIDLAQKIASLQQGNGQFTFPEQAEEKMVNYHMWSVLALYSAGYKIPDRDSAKKWLLASQNKDGGFGWKAGLDSDPDDTAVAIQTLVCLGEDPKKSQVIKNALDYLKSCQQPDGGFGLPGAANSASDSWVLQGLIAAGENPAMGKWKANQKNVLDHLCGLQSPDGSFYWKGKVVSSPAFMTAYCLTALSGKPYPVNRTLGMQEQTPAQQFSDLSTEHWAYDSIMSLVRAGVVGGYPDGTFRPSKDVTRAECTKFILTGLNYMKPEPVAKTGFRDVPQDYWAAPFIYLAAKNGYVAGKSDGIFSPDEAVKGAELAAILVRTLPQQVNQDVSQGDAGSFWYSQSVLLAKEKGLLYPNFSPDGKVTRAQCAYSIARLRQILTEPAE